MQIKIPYKPRELQMDFHKNKKRWNFLVCHRRFGKSILAVNELVKEAITCKLERPRYAYIAPTYKDAKRIIWDYVKHYTNMIPGVKYNESELRVDFPNGARIQLLGSEDPDSIRGIYLDGVVLDEYQNQKPNLFNEILRPALADRKGWAMFIGTPKGRNHFFDLNNLAQKDPDWYYANHKASETGYIDKDELDAAYKSYVDQGDEDTYMQEFENSFDAALKGAIFGDNMKILEEQNRITSIHLTKGEPVYTAWDIGRSDSTVIIFFQLIGKEIRIIDHYQGNNLDLRDYMAVINSKGYEYDRHYLPHDADHKRLSVNNESVKEQLEGLGLKNVHIIERDAQKEASIQRSKEMFQYVWIDSDQDMLIRALKEYIREFNEKKNIFSKDPLHDWCSDYADAFQYAMTACQSLMKVVGKDRKDMRDFTRYLKSQSIT